MLPVLVGLASVVSEARAQSPCSTADSIQSCWHRYHPDAFIALNSTEARERARERREEAARKERIEAVNDLLDLVTSSAVVGADTAATVTNFLPLLALTGLGGSLDGDDDSATASDQDVAFDLNLPFFGSNGANALKLQAAFVRDPELFQPLVDAVPDADRDRFTTLFDRELQIGDDARFSLSYHFVNRRFGRDFRPHLNKFEELHQAATAGVTVPDLATVFGQAQDLVIAQTGDPRSTPPGNRLPLEDWRLAGVADADMEQLRAGVLALVETAAQQMKTMTERENDALRRYGVLDFRKLVDAQPQLMFTLTARERDPLVGADELSLSFGLEWPLGGNLSGFERQHGAACRPSWRSDACLEGFRAYLADQARISAYSPRFSLKVEYSDIDAYSASFADPMVSLTRDSSSSLALSAGFGMRLAEDGFGSDSRLDLSARHEDVSDDPERNNRTVASLTWTKQFGDISVPLSIVYSNKPEYLNQQGLDERFSAFIGLKYELKQRETN